MSKGHEDPSVAFFLELDGTVHFVDEKCRFRVEIQARRTEVTPERPHGLSYSLTLHDADGSRILGFDNAHPVPANRGPGGRRHKYHDHRHRFETTRIYAFTDTETLISDFYRAVDRVLKDKGVKT
ncbi:MAG: DUF6516 family protein [Alphaproteobacteria bacterium]|jgi:hypothetical protein|nr:DUF6516 family protein [Alphaproteobacteria bacterium]MDP6830839.1 DUF6516 family protein [Alphaproteobacteria bacterium]MDP6876527.1 DUF6516 family protein [Alphaproteobacteria bacterium]